MKVRREAIPYALSGGLLAAFFAAAGLYYAAAPPFLFFLFSLFFFRDPRRVFEGGPEILVSPADGKIIKVTDDGEKIFLSVFMSVMNVHINRSPAEGVILSKEYSQGTYLAAYHEKASLENERLRWVIETRFGDIECTQIAGLIARRIHPLKQAGENLRRGQEIGLIAFGSRVDVVLPKSTCELLVKPGDRVRGGISPMAKGKIR
ncbi:MAG TPA: phosphatidylserine decarboxylase [Acidobacteriota bacterium]|nr:phosphatidylserine decarboxylase [Acidobacteriota bacterium]HNT17443.1 phosphatidylserine decarboxylase [Acidobacteriota bacterium]HPA26201.1 phosphatidylserine decarboxylase [Acidobacteriota bacterium]HQO18759.1 phosphatidylserine decarboxylase [Acidobacteriota bacterium]HQQ46884.1 phosphatidylserine decarboxylase [Acidobacteriota bacterium]